MAASIPSTAPAASPASGRGRPPPSPGRIPSRLGSPHGSSPHRVRSSAPLPARRDGAGLPRPLRADAQSAEHEQGAAHQRRVRLPRGPRPPPGPGAAGRGGGRVRRARAHLPAQGLPRLQGDAREDARGDDPATRVDPAGRGSGGAPLPPCARLGGR